MKSTTFTIHKFDASIFKEACNGFATVLNESVANENSLDIEVRYDSEVALMYIGMRFEQLKNQIEKIENT